MTRITVTIPLITLLTSAFVQADDMSATSVGSLITHPHVVMAMRLAWAKARFGLTGVEAGFRLDGTPSAYVIVTASFTNELRKLQLEIHPRTTFAIFHVHALGGDPWPSPADKAIANRYRITVVTMHRSGVYEYDPHTRTSTRLKEQLEWLKPPAATTPLIEP